MFAARCVRGLSLLDQWRLDVAQVVRGASAV